MMKSDPVKPGGAASSKRSAIIYNHTILSGSMTFIRSHAEALETFIPVYAGAHRARYGLDVPEDRVFVVNNNSLTGKLREYIFRTWGRAEPFVRDLRNCNPVIVHTHFGTSGPTGLYLAKQLEVPLLVTFHGADATIARSVAAASRRGRELIRGKRQLISETARFIAVSNYIKDRLLQQGYPDEKIAVHYNGIDLEFFRPDRDQKREALIVFVGRFVEKKGVDVLVAATAELQKAGVEFKLVLIGDGPLRDSLKIACDRANLDCHFTGFLAVDEVRQWLAKAAVVAVPSVTAADGDSEGLPTILLEAQAMEAPVVATYHSGIPEGVIDNRTAELVDPGDKRALAASLQSFLTSPEKVREFGLAGREFVTGKFELRQQVQGLEHIYNDLIARHANDHQPFAS